MPSNKQHLPPKSFTAKYQGLVNVLKTDVTIHPAFKPGDRPSSDGKKYLAIWDTGATNSVISERVAKEIGLAPIGMAQVHTAGGTVTTPTYLVNIMLPSQVGLAMIKVSQAKKLSGDADILIGMDIIAAGDFAVTNKNQKTVFSFRFPSTQEIDFVKQYNSSTEIAGSQSISKRIKPNDPCPCGSGMKFKKCCRNKSKTVN